ncbi:MAG: protease [Candidatus Rokubacteria bacterium RIFCSPHIGHO2_02_FULL_73_26]|nr:MAG: protease [Candidatus Rokubacteria bacterium RIFCSPHIGHO2_02_FULL_73_26]OGL29887.1 MAG: protease [Candidatus Rokubacteria bacterium RIFCSPLOWO2_12_FULL_73_47]
MAAKLTIGLIDAAKPAAQELVREGARRLPHLRYADLRLEVGEAKGVAAENGAPKSSGDDYAFALGVRVLAGDRMVAPGYAGLTLGAADAADLPRVLREALERAYRRAVANAEHKAEARDKFGPLGAALADTRLHPVEVRQDTVAAVYRIDPRAVALDEMVRYTVDVSRRVAAADPAIRYNHVGTTTGLTRELFVSSEGAALDQTFALTQGVCAVVAVAGETSHELHDALGHQRGWEILLEGVDDPLLPFPRFVDFALQMAREAARVAAAPPLPTSAGEVVVVTDPHYNTLVAHEIVGHPGELDRALKLETAYAGRSWLLGGLDAHQVGRRVASPLVSAYSDPALPGYGHYAYDHEGTPARRVVHIDRGIFLGFMNSRQTAAIFGGAPNGHWTATDASLVPLVRMSTTVFAAGTRPPADILEEVDRGFYVVGHRIPSIAESRENFRISARMVYEIEKGELGRLYRDGGIAADSREYLLNVDAVGTDFRLYPIPNCGKGQPMQTKKLGNGGPTMRSRARVVGGA